MNAMNKDLGQSNKYFNNTKKSEELGKPNEEDKKKRARRLADQIHRHYKCPIEVCKKSYGSEGSLNQHIKLKHPEIYTGQDILDDSRSTYSMSENFNQNQSSQLASQQQQQKKPYQTLLAFLLAGLIGKELIKNRMSEVKLSYFIQALSMNLISEVILQGSRIRFKARDSETWYQTNSEVITKDQMFKLLNKQDNITFSCENAEPAKSSDLPALAVASILGIYMTSRMLKMLNQQNYKPKNADDEFHQQLRFKDIAGLQEAKEKLTEIISYLKEPQKYQKVGARLRKGVLLYGPPGTGKTMLAKATAGESNSQFLYTTASEFVEMYVGVGAKRVRELFSQAKRKAPCIVFIDEIDGLGQKRSQFSGNDAGGSDQERATTLNQLLTEMDGFQDISNVVVIAATNREKLLDKALVRSGRFDTKIHISMPEEKDRLEILQIHTRDKQHHISQETLNQIAQQSQNFSGADLESVVNESAYICIKDNRQEISNDDLFQAFNKFKKEKNSFE
ncbi:P-loop containing nucleoside triphosphate hydrolase [Pseudocohnilembus persalinus]|uniref:p-loop containing nucleoside triphosphate hydrolase n=1 Tax=Pseudocohnilembus persalinus TaxID=266149 RepID=A0A0V0QCK2_PSEPJ|nr:P-loop containing nucleoside triphosphate hydrolase [Pseudocohnilembus persalinus]|eukprot:KRW99957.1 P-loop containing nucleoside triphosphate hydrolase [Pseudocohnilembus persalinus]